MTVDQMVELEFGSSSKHKKKDFFLMSDCSLNEQHSYWHQIQGEIYATGVPWADLAVWTSKDLKVLRILKHDLWEQTNIEKLDDFYVNVLLPNCYTKE